jgi:hypothetical protein
VIAEFHPFDPTTHAMRETEREANERGISVQALLNERLAQAIDKLAELNAALIAARNEAAA